MICLMRKAEGGSYMKLSKIVGISPCLDSRITICTLGNKYSGNNVFPSKIPLLLVIVMYVLLIGATSVHGANHYVRAGATGDNSGSDWTNSWRILPTALTRGDTYYIANGTYSGHSFNDAEYGTYYIYIYKATTTDHGTDTGWSSSYGDGQTTFTGTIYFTTSNWIFDGKTRNENDWSDNLSYGFAVAPGAGGSGTSWQFAVYKEGANVDNITIKHTFSYFDHVNTGGDVPENWNLGIYMPYNAHNFTYERNKMMNISQQAALLTNNGCANLTLRYNYFENILRKELISSQGGVGNVIFAFNYVKNVAGTGIIVADNANGWEIYGNVFWSPDAMYTFSDVSIGTWTGGTDPGRNKTLNDWKIYNNTFYKMRGAFPSSTQIQIQHGSGNVAANNLFIGFTSSINGAITDITNTQNADTSVVKNVSVGVFTLTGATAAGTKYSSPYNVDVLGNTRGADGVWDRGAFEFKNVAPSPPIVKGVPH
jgi:hypothetical protein